MNPCKIKTKSHPRELRRPGPPSCQFPEPLIQRRPPTGGSPTAVPQFPLAVTTRCRHRALAGASPAQLLSALPLPLLPKPWQATVSPGSHCSHVPSPSEASISLGPGPCHPEGLQNIPTPMLSLWRRQLGKGKARWGPPAHVSLGEGLGLAASHSLLTWSLLQPARPPICFPCSCDTLTVKAYGALAHMSLRASNVIKTHSHSQGAEAQTGMMVNCSTQGQEQEKPDDDSQVVRKFVLHLKGLARFAGHGDRPCSRDKKLGRAGRGGSRL